MRGPACPDPAVLRGDGPNPRHALEKSSADRAASTGRFWTRGFAGCAVWPAVVADGHDGPWNTPTAHPVLVLGASHVPSTPLSPARAMAGKPATSVCSPTTDTGTPRCSAPAAGSRPAGAAVPSTAPSRRQE
ncbi:alpha/beta hydrolase [Streptomyces sp. YIM B13518]|uniref:alpha/beta hydrolase n=1 Tax=Streptomyces sp. YIM B13518 TaxID=3366316 RepID=UPI003698FD6C